MLLSEGSYVKYGQALATWVKTQDLILEAYIPFEQSQIIKKGNPAHFKNGLAFVSEITPESKGGMIKILLKSSQKLPLNLKFPLKIDGPQKTGWKLPKSVLILEEGQIYVFKIEQGKIKKIALKILEDKGSFVLVENTFKATDIFAANQLENLTEGTEVSF